MHPDLPETTSEKSASLLTGGLRIGAKQLPFGIGTVVSLGSAASRLAGGDFTGAGLDVGSAIASPFPGLGTPISLGLDGINLVRDLTSESKGHRFDHALDEEQDNPKSKALEMQQLRLAEQQQALNNFDTKTASSTLVKDLEDPTQGKDSDLYGALEPLISSETDDNLTGAEAERTKNLKDQVRKGVVALQYATGLKKNTGETFYDKHPAQAVATDLLKKSPLLGLGVGGAMLGTNYLRQWANMRKTEPSKMSRTDNPFDKSNPSNILDSAGEHSRLFGDLEGNIEHRLKLLDSLTGKAPNAPDALLSRYRQAAELKNNISSEHALKLKELTSKLESAANPGEIQKLNSLIQAQNNTYTQTLAQHDKEIKKLIEEAKSSHGNAALRKYVNLSESLRRANEKGGLTGYIGEGLGSFSGIPDIAEKYHITGAHPHFDQELFENVAMEHAGPRASAAQKKKFLSEILPTIADADYQSSGLRKALYRAKVPLLTGGAIAAGGYGLHKLVKALQDQSYSSKQLQDWKNTLRKSRGDFEETA
jgi:hypothetical protein